jgi:hypothetical protein
MTDNISKRYENFSTRLHHTFVRRQGQPNLLRHQRDTISWIQNQDDFIIINCDKGLGPAIMEKPRYAKLVLTHLLTTRVYTRLDSRQSRAALTQSQTLLANWVKKYTKDKTLSASERKYLRNYASTVNPSKPFSVFYTMPKIHKTPLAICPVVSYSDILRLPPLWPGSLVR